MDGVCKELDEVKAELEKLKEDYRTKTELSECLRRAHTDQIEKIQEAKLQIEKQAKELNTKCEEITELRQLYEENKSKLHETESSLKQVTCMNEKFRFDSGEKVQKLEGENRKLVSALEEATERNEDMVRKLCARNEEIKGLKALLSDSERKCSEAEEKARAGKELRHRDDVISRLEEQSMNVQDQLKWKKEQFAHLEDAHKRLQDEFKSSKAQWASDKSALLEEISILQSKLDSQIRIAESLESRLKMCNQALAHEESKRKMLEVQLSESKQCFENVLAECEEAKVRIESLSAKRDEEIAGLRNSLGMKETLMKEMNYRVVHLEQENKELLGTVKELQEAQISKRKPDPSLPKLRNKLRDLEQVHNNCALTLKEKEAEWNLKMEKLIGDMKCYESDLKTQTEQMHQLKIQLDNCHSAMEVSGEENSILLMVLKSELSDAYSKLFSSEAQVEALSEERGENASAEHLQMGHNSLLKAQGDLQQACKEITSLTQKLDSLALLEKRSTLLEKELEEHKKMLEDSSSYQLRLKEQVSEMEVALRNVSDALEKSKSKLALKISEASQAEMELQMWKPKVESLRTCLEQSREICKQLETSLSKQAETEQGLRKENQSLLCTLEEQEQRIVDLQQKIATLDHKLVQAEVSNEAIKLEMAEAHKKEGDYVRIIKEKDATVENLLREKETVEQESARREYEAAESSRLEAENKFRCEKEKLCVITREKDEQISCLQGLASSLEQKIMDMVVFSFAQDVENLIKMNALEEAIKKTESHMNTEMKRKNNAIDTLEKEINHLRGKVLIKEESLFQSNQSAKVLEVLLEGKNFEMDKMVFKLGDEQIKLKELVKDLEQEIYVATANIKTLSSERDSLLSYIEELCGQVGEFCAQDVKLEEMFQKMLPNSEEAASFESDIIPDKFSDVQKDVSYTRTTKEVETSPDRSPLREINQ